MRWLFIALFIESAGADFFSRMTVLPVAIGSMIVFSLFVQMSEGATYSVVPFINKKALGSVAGIVGAGGNMGAVAAGFLFRAEGITWPTALLILGGIVFLISFVALLVRFSEADEKAAAGEHARRPSRSALASRASRASSCRGPPVPGQRVTPDRRAAHLPGRRAHDQGHLLHHEHGRARGPDGGKPSATRRT